MLGHARLMAFVSTSDPKRALAFYGDTLGLQLVEETPYALVFDVGGTTLRVTVAQQVVTAPYTVLGWTVDDIQATATALQQAGIELQRFDNLDQDAHGIWTSPTGAQVIWFHDPDGNVLSATQG